MKKVVKIEEKSKVKKARVVEVKRLKEYGAMEVDTRIALIQDILRPFICRRCCRKDKKDKYDNTG